MRKFIRTFILCMTIGFGIVQANASPQMPDYILYEGDTIRTYNLLLESYLHKLDSTKVESLFGLSFRNGASFNCWRGYQALYKLERDSLFLANIISCGELRNGVIDKLASSNKMKSIFGNKVKNGMVHIDWFNGNLNFPTSNEILRWDGVFNTIYERERVLNILDGVVLETSDVENYEQVPNGINRKDKKEISDLLFKYLRKVKWKNENEFDCSEKYLVTIDENGIVSKVRMLYTAEEIEKYYEEDEYNFCLYQMFNGLKKLQFDIIKEKGIPISEDVYLEIWVKDNWRLENWTD